MTAPEPNGLVTELVEALRDLGWAENDGDEPCFCLPDPRETRPYRTHCTRCVMARRLLARATPEAVRKADAAPELIRTGRRLFDQLDAAANHFDDGNAEAAREVIARYFELWSEDDRALLSKAEGR